MKFDIYYSDKLNREAITEKLASMEKNYPEIIKNWSAKPGFQFLDLEEYIAADIVEAAIRCRQYAIVVPVGYRTPAVSVEVAEKIAKNEIDRIVSQAPFKEIVFQHLRFSGEEAMWWKFVAPSEELQNKGVIPGALFIRVDKLDGRIISSTEAVNLFFEEYHFDTALTTSPENLAQDWQQRYGLTHRTDYFDNNREVLYGSAVMIAALKHPYPKLVEKKFQINPSLQIRFRLIPHQRGHEHSRKLVSEIITDLISRDNSDFVFTLAAGDLKALARRDAGVIYIDDSIKDWFYS
jgi:hypothetical protein